MADAASSDSIDDSEWTWSLVLERLLGVKVSEGWEKVHNSKWVEFESYDHMTTKKPPRDDTKLVYWRSQCKKETNFYSLPNAAGSNTTEITKYNVVKVKIPYQSTDGGNPKDTFVNWATSISKADLRFPDALNRLKTEKATNRFREARDLAASLADGLAGLIAGIDTKASGFAGSAAAAAAYDLDAIKTAFRTVEWEMSSGTSGDLVGCQYIYALTNVGEAQKKFCDFVDFTWRDWIAKADGPVEILMGIDKQIMETWTDRSFDGDDGWRYHISYKAPFAGESAPSPIEVDLRESQGWTAIDKYARDLWKASIVDGLETPVKNEVEKLKQELTGAKNKFTANSYNFIDGLPSVKGSDGKGDGDESDLDKITKAFEDATPESDDPTDGTEGGGREGWPDLPTDGKSVDSGWPDNLPTDTDGNGDWASVIDGGGGGGWSETTDGGGGGGWSESTDGGGGGGWSESTDGDGEVTYPGLGGLTPKPWDAGSQDSDSNSGSSGVYSDFEEGDLPAYSSVSGEPDLEMLPSEISEGHSSGGGIGGIDGALDPLRLGQETADAGTTASVLGDSVGLSTGSGAGTPSGYGGMPMSPMAGGAGAGQQEKERERTTWLAEEEDVWGTDPDCAPAVLGRFDDASAPGESTRPTQQPTRRTQPGQVPTRQQVRGRG